MVFDEWSFRWFGAWRDRSSEQISRGEPDYRDPAVVHRHPHLANFVDIATFIDLDWARSLEGDLDKLVSYLDSGKIFGLYPALECVFDDCKYPLLNSCSRVCTYSPVTDGIWLWYDNLSHYVKYHNVRIPDSMYAHIASKSFVLPDPLPELTDELIKSLDWAFLPPPLAARLGRVNP